MTHFTTPRKLGVPLPLVLLCLAPGHYGPRFKLQVCGIDIVFVSFSLPLSLVK